MIKPIAADLPYPSIDNITPDIVSAKIISPAYAGCGSEMTAILQYLYHHFIFFRENLPDYSEELEAIAITEMHHLNILGKMLTKLGVDPVFTAKPPIKCDFYNTSVIAYSSDPVKMIMDDLTAEIKAIDMYESMVSRLCNQRVAVVIQRIILDEQQHVKALSVLLKNIETEKK